MKPTNIPRRLETFAFERKVYAVEPRLGVFRFLEYWRLPEFLSFDSERGVEMLLAMDVSCGSSDFGKSMC